MAEIGGYVLPVLIMLTLTHGLLRRVPVFDVFLSGAAAGLQTALRLLPTLVGLITAIAMFKASGALNWLTAAARPAAALLGLPEEVIPLMLIHPVSGGGATAVLTDLFERFGPDSAVGLVASVLCGSGETTFYAITVYYGSCGIRSTRHTLAAALAADFAAAVFSGLGAALFLR